MYSSASIGRTPAELQRSVDELLWYHTIDLAAGVATKGMFDNRHSLSVMPFPDVQGKRCLDIGTWDGFYAYEMERRGAAEVVALDVPDLSGVDFPPEVRASDADLSFSDQQDRSAGFDLLHGLLDSKVEWRAGNIYDLNPVEFGLFDVVVIGSLLVHLRDPVRALDAVRGVCRGALLVADYLHTPVTMYARRRPLFELRGQGVDFQWWLPNDAGLRRLIEIGGFDIDAVSDYYLLRFGPALTKTQRATRTLRGAAKFAVNYALTRDRAGGHLHRAYCCHPRF